MASGPLIPVLVGLLAAGSLSNAEARPRPMGGGAALLARGQPRLAVDAFRRKLDAGRATTADRLGLARALAQLGECDRVSEVLDPVRSDPGFDVRGWLAEAECAFGRGDWARAVAAAEEAVAVDPSSERSWVVLASALGRMGELDRAYAASSELQGLPRGHVLQPLVDARLALGTPEFPRAQAELHRTVERRKSVSLEAQYELISALAWMLEGQPVHAADALWFSVIADIRDPQYGLWRAEACRRAGDLACARQAAWRPAMTNRVSPPLGFNVRARILADEGDLEGARSAIDGHPAPDQDPDYVATLWYIARAAGEPAERYEAWYDVVRNPSDGPLEHLVPLPGESR